MGLPSIGGSSIVAGSASLIAVVDGGRTSGRPAKGHLMETFESFRLCMSVRARMIGILLLVGSEGRSSGSCAATLATVSVRLKLVNLDGGNGLEPEGREKRLLRRSSR